jgi:hypothetical protein
VGGECFGLHYPGENVVLRAHTGNRWQVYDEQTRGLAFVDEADLALRGTPATHLKSVVAVVASPPIYAHTATALRSLAEWLRRAAGPGDTVWFTWMAGISAGDRASIVPQLNLPEFETSAKSDTVAGASPTPRPCYFDPVCRAAATATAQVVTAQQTREAQASSTARQRFAQAIEGAATALVAAAATPLDGEADLALGMARGAALLARAPGERWLLLAGPLGTSELQNGLDPAALEGVHVRFIYPQCPDSATCQANGAAWQAWAATHKLDYAVIDPSADLAQLVR